KRRKPGRFERLKEVARSQPVPPTVVAYDDRILDEASVRQIRDGLLGAAAKEKHQMTLSLFHWTGFEQAPADFDQVLAETRKTYPAPDGLEFDARRAQRLKTTAALQSQRTSLQVIEIAERAACLTDESIQKVVKEYPPSPPLACREGCAWCCHKLVGTTALEVF